MPTAFIKIDTKAAFILVLAAAVIAWVMLAPESAQAAVDAVADAVPTIDVSIGR